MGKAWGIAVLTLLIQGCGEHYENRIPVATCETGTLYVTERVDVSSGLDGRSESSDFGLYYVGRHGKRVDIMASSLGSYGPPIVERLKVYRTPQQGDWQLYVAPADVTAGEYDVLSNCIGARMHEIERQMAVSRAPFPLVPSKRALPGIATIRHASLIDLRKQYQCGHEGTLRLQENGLIYLQHDDSVLVGSVTDEGKGVVLDESILGYLTTRTDRRIADPMSYLEDCRSDSGRSLFEQFQVSTVPDVIVGMASAHK